MAKSCMTHTILPLAATVLLATSLLAGENPNAGPGITSDGLHGIHRVGLPYATTKQISLSGDIGYGLIESMGPVKGMHHRLAGRFAAGFAPLRWLSFRLALDGNYDWHPDDAEGKEVTGLGSPRLALRGGFPLGRMAQLGLEVDWWVPGAGAPSMKWDASTLDSKLLFALSPADARWSIASLVGFRFDNSANAAPDPRTLRPGDRISLGVSDFNALLLGLGASVRFNRLELLAEVTSQLLMGEGAPMVSSPLRFAFGGRYRIIDALRIQLMTETHLLKRPDLTPEAPFVPIEPRFGVGLGLAYAFDLGPKAPPPPPPAPPVVKEISPPPPPRPPAPPTTLLTGAVLDGEGNPVGGAMVQLTAGETSMETETGPSGEFRFEAAPIGKTTVKTGAEGFEESESTIDITTDMPAMAPIMLNIEAAAQASQLRGLVRSFDGTPVKATILILPNKTELQTDESGGFVVDLPTGKYSVKILAKGYRRQVRDVEIEENSVTILNVDLRKR